MWNTVSPLEIKEEYQCTHWNTDEDKEWTQAYVENYQSSALTIEWTFLNYKYKRTSVFCILYLLLLL